MSRRCGSDEGFGLAFLDLISCGLGGVLVLMLVFSSMAQDGGSSKRLAEAVHGNQAEGKRNRDDFLLVMITSQGVQPPLPGGLIGKPAVVTRLARLEARAPFGDNYISTETKAISQAGRYRRTLFRGKDLPEDLGTLTFPLGDGRGNSHPLMALFAAAMADADPHPQLKSRLLAGVDRLLRIQDSEAWDSEWQRMDLHLKRWRNRKPILNLLNELKLGRQAHDEALFLCEVVTITARGPGRKTFIADGGARIKLKKVEGRAVLEVE